MASYKVLFAATCLTACIVYTNGMPASHGYAQSYLESNLDFGLSLGGYGGQSEGLGSGKGLGASSGGLGGSSGGLGEYGGQSEGLGSSKGLGGSSKGLEGSSGGSGGGESSGKGYKHEEVYANHHPKYSFKYGVQDKHTGDYKDQKEERDGDVVRGEYSLLQPDGRKRTVHYTASKHGGFQAQVSYSGHAIHPEVQQHKL